MARSDADETRTGSRSTETTYGGQVVGRALKDGGVDSVFGIDGSINLAIEEANHHGVKMYHFRHVTAQAPTRSMSETGAW